MLITTTCATNHTLTNYSTSLYRANRSSSLSPQGKESFPKPSQNNSEQEDASSQRDEGSARPTDTLVTADPSQKVLSPTQTEAAEKEDDRGRGRRDGPRNHEE